MINTIKSFVLVVTAAEWEQILTILVLSVLRIDGILIGYGLLTNRFVRD